MNILIVTDYLYPNLSANSGIAFRIAQELKNNHFCKISILGFSSKEDKQVIFETYGFKAYNLNNVEKCNRINKKCRNKFLRYLFKLSCIKYVLRERKYDYHNVMGMEYRDMIKKLCSKEKFDCVIGFSTPFMVLVALSNARLNIPFISYKLDPDPSGMKELSYYCALSDSLLEYEKQADKKASAIILAKAFANDYINSCDDVIKNKIFSLDFPNIIKPQQILLRKHFDDEHIHCVFTGNLYSDIRNPLFTFKLFRYLKKSNIILHIIGHKKSDRMIPDDVSDNIVFHGKVSSDSALVYMQKADVLLNIGNTVQHMFPSKILTYISLGKPILNIVKSPQCPTLPYMEKYPLALNITETPEVRQEDVERARDFILTKYREAVPFEEIEKLYYTCTPEYVGDRLYNIICKVIKDKEKKEYDGTAEV